MTFLFLAVFYTSIFVRPGAFFAGMEMFKREEGKEPERPGSS